jgi:hypothetical protein
MIAIELSLRDTINCSHRNPSLERPGYHQAPLCGKPISSDPYDRHRASVPVIPQSQRESSKLLLHFGNTPAEFP